MSTFLVVLAVILSILAVVALGLGWLGRADIVSRWTAAALCLATAVLGVTLLVVWGVTP